jgi:hypothetical protein
MLGAILRKVNAQWHCCPVFSSPSAEKDDSRTAQPRTSLLEFRKNRVSTANWLFLHTRLSVLEHFTGEELQVKFSGGFS